jgi:hypothetical protein
MPRDYYVTKMLKSKLQQTSFLADFRKNRSQEDHKFESHWNPEPVEAYGTRDPLITILKQRLVSPRTEPMSTYQVTLTGFLRVFV